jgi:hypothetical protein
MSVCVCESKDEGWNGRFEVPVKEIDRNEEK